MKIGQSIFEALDSLTANKTRAALTILGIVIGVAAVIAMLGVGQGAQDSITGAISGIGSNLLFVFSGNFQEEVRNAKPLTLDDAGAISDPFQAPSVAAVAPTIDSRLEISFSGERSSFDVIGVTPDYAQVRNFALLEGELINEEHLLGRASVVILGAEVADKLFGHRDGIIGESVRIEGQPFLVIGVFEPKGGGSFGSQDDFAAIPLTTAQSRLIRRAQGEIDVLYVQAASSDVVTQAFDEITQILRSRHRIILGANDFTIFTQQDFVETAKTITNVFTIFLGGVAGISLLVGGIGIMNIMLVSVTERTREIGLRKALGARKRDILYQFLTESSLLSFLGGLIGIAVGWLLSFIVGRIAAANNTPITPSISLQSILLATLFSTAVGLFFGIYPANRAASLEPVEALRYE